MPHSRQGGADTDPSLDQEETGLKQRTQRGQNRRRNRVGNESACRRALDRSRYLDLDGSAHPFIPGWHSRRRALVARHGDCAARRCGQGHRRGALLAGRTAVVFRRGAGSAKQPQARPLKKNNCKQDVSKSLQVSNLVAGLRVVQTLLARRQPDDILLRCQL